MNIHSLIRILLLHALSEGKFKVLRKNAVASLTAALLLLSGCQSAADVIARHNGEQIDVGYDTSHVKVDEKIASLVPEKIARDGKLTMGVNLYWAPAEYKIGSTPVGYDIDMMKAVAAKMGLTLDVQNAEFDSILPGIPERYEVAASAFTITKERQANFNLIQYYTIGTSWAVLKENPTAFSPEHLCGRIVGVQTGTTQEDEVKEAAEQCAEKPDIQSYDSQDSITQALVGGKIEAMAADSSVIDYAIQRTGNTLETTGIITATSPQGVVVEKTDPHMTQAMQAALQSLMDDGTLKEIFAAWGIKDNVADQALINPVN